MSYRDEHGPSTARTRSRSRDDTGTVSTVRSRVRFDLSASGTLYKPPSPGSDGASIQTGRTRTGSLSGTPMSSSPDRIMDERAPLGSTRHPAYCAISHSPFESIRHVDGIDPTQSLPSSVFSSAADLVDLRASHLKTARPHSLSNTSNEEGAEQKRGNHHRLTPLVRVGHGLKRWIGNSGIAFDFALPPSLNRKRRRQELGDGSRQEQGHGRGRVGRHGPTRGDCKDVDEDDGDEEADWWSDRIGPEGLILPLLIITFSCALADAGTLIHFSTFATSMTGNTVLVAVALMNATDKSPLYAAVALLGFIGTGLITGQLGAAYGNRSRSWLLSSMTFQILVLGLTLVLVSPRGPLKVGREFDWVYVFFIGIQGGAQVTMAANSGARELPTAMMTTPYAAFVSDPTLFRSGANKDVRARNRRFVYIATFWAGSFLGAVIARWSTLWVMTAVVLGCKAVVAAMIAFTKGESEAMRAAHRPQTEPGSGGVLGGAGEVDDDETDADADTIESGSRARFARVRQKGLGQDSVAGAGASSDAPKRSSSSSPWARSRSQSRSRSRFKPIDEAAIAAGLGDDDDPGRLSIHEAQYRHSLRVKRRASSVFERLQDQEPRDERDVAF